MVWAAISKSSLAAAGARSGQVSFCFVLFGHYRTSVTRMAVIAGGRWSSFRCRRGGEILTADGHEIHADGIQTGKRKAFERSNEHLCAPAERFCGGRCRGIGSAVPRDLRALGGDPRLKSWAILMPSLPGLRIGNRASLSAHNLPNPIINIRYENHGPSIMFTRPSVSSKDHAG